MKKYFLFIAILLSHGDLAFANLQEIIKQTTNDYLANRFLNATFLFADNDNVLEVGAKGIFSVDTGEQLKANQQMPIASSTKPITAAAILRLQDKGLLNVYDKIQKYLTKNSGIWDNDIVPAWAGKISIHNLLTHTSGLTEYFGVVKIDPEMPHTQINKRIVNYVAGKALEFKPGEKYKYCGTNYLLLGLIIERVSGKAVEQFFQDEFFVPLEMKSTHLASLSEGLKIQHYPESTEYPIRYFITPTGKKPKFNKASVDFIFVPYADGGIISNTSDLVKWHKALHQGKILSDKSYKLMTAKHYIRDDKFGRKSHTGYGVFISELANGDIMIHHSGSAVGIRSETGYITNKNLYFAILSNVMVNIPKDMVDKIDLAVPENQLDIVYFREAILKSISDL